MENRGIVLLGLGPGNPILLTRQAWELLNYEGEVYLRTRKHPVVDVFPERLKVFSFDDLYDSCDSFDEVYEKIISKVLSLGRRPQGVIYAVPGHPYIAEATGPEIARRAHQENIPVQVVEGLSFFEPLVTALGLDPFPHTSLVDALDLGRLHVPPFPPSAGAIIAQVHSSLVASEVKLTLMSVYPDEFQVTLVHAAGTPAERVESLSLYEIDQSPNIGLLTALYVPPLGARTSFEAFQEVVAHLRAPDGCPWDREQTHQSLRSSLLEEAYEALSALDADDPDAMREEFGDLLLLVIMQAQIGAEYGEFTMADVINGIHTKIVGRHPHVFGELELEDIDGVLLNWEKLKAAEREANGNGEASLLDGVALALPGLVQAEQYQKRASRVGFDWPNIAGVFAKVDEEMQEVIAASEVDSRFQEIGDLLFAVVNLARWLDIDAESALREANKRFRERFSLIEAAARSQERAISDLSLEEMENLWQAAKKTK